MDLKKGERIPLSDLSANVCADTIEVTPMREPDRKWRFTDAAGHEHKWRMFEHSSAAIETCKIEDYLDEEGTVALRYVCAECGEVISPKYVATCFRSFVLGAYHASINGVEVTREEGELALTVLAAMNGGGE